MPRSVWARGSALAEGNWQRQRALTEGARIATAALGGCAMTMRATSLGRAHAAADASSRPVRIAGTFPHGNHRSDRAYHGLVGISARSRSNDREARRQSHRLRHTLDERTGALGTPPWVDERVNN